MKNRNLNLKKLELIQIEKIGIKNTKHVGSTYLNIWTFFDTNFNLNKCQALKIIQKLVQFELFNYSNNMIGMISNEKY